MKKQVVYIITIIAIALNSFNVLATIKTESTVLKNTATVKVSKLSNATNINSSTTQLKVPAGVYKDVFVNNTITLGIDNDMLSTVIPSGRVITVTLKIEPFDQTGLALPNFTKDFVITYNPYNNAVNYNDKAIYTFSNAYKVIVTVMNIKDGAGANSEELYDNMYIRNDI